MSQEEKQTWLEDSETQTVTEHKAKLKKPDMYRVLLLNDDYTPMEFVVWVLQTVFHKPHELANKLMLDVHHKGRGLCGVYTYDVARTKIFQVLNLAEKHNHPLQCTMEVEEYD